MRIGILLRHIDRHPKLLHRQSMTMILPSSTAAESNWFARRRVSEVRRRITSTIDRKVEADNGSRLFRQPRPRMQQKSATISEILLLLGVLGRLYASMR